MGDSELKRASAYLAKMDASIAGQGGDEDLLKAVTKMASGFNLSDDETYNIIMNEFNPRCSPPWKSGDVKAKIKSVGRRGRHGDLLDSPTGYNKIFDIIDRNLGIYSIKDKKKFDDSLIGEADRHPWLEKTVYVTEMCNFLNDTACNARPMSYLSSPARRVSAKSIAEWRLGWHPGVDRISIPQYDRNGRLVNISGRVVEPIHEILDPDWKVIKWLHARDFKKELYLFGEDKFLTFDKTQALALVEGQFDAIALYAAGIRNVASMLGSHVSDTQIMKMITWFNKVVIIKDGDIKGQVAADEVISKIEYRIDSAVFPTRRDQDPDTLDADQMDELKSNYGLTVVDS